MRLNEYPSKINRGMVFYTSKDVIIEYDNHEICIPKYTLVEIKRQAVVSGIGHGNIEYYVVYYKQHSGFVSDAMINRRDIHFYCVNLKDLWDDYGRYQKELQHKLLLQAN